jgi:hypothetical protein
MAPILARSSVEQLALIAPSEKARLLELTAKNDAAQSLFGVLKGEADAALNSEPHPIRKIQTQHKLAGDPDKAATQTSLKDMRTLSILGYAYEVTGRAIYSYKAKEFILAWARINIPTGEPIDETNLEPLIVAYDLTRETFSDGDRKAADAYLRRIVEAEWGARQVTSNWQSHRLKIVGLSAYVLRDDALIAKAIEGFKRQVDANLNPDGSSFDFLKRDALHYHVYDLEPLLTLAIAAHAHGVDLYDYTSDEGASLHKSVNFLVPFCTGEKSHHEFVHSQVAFDRTRAENGQSEYEAGHLFHPEEGFMALCLAEYFDVSLDPVIGKLAGQNRDMMASWRLLLNTANRTK